MTPDELRKLQRAHERAAVKAKAAQEARNAGVREALAEGWTHAAIADATGLTRGRVGQMAQAQEQTKGKR